MRATRFLAMLGLSACYTALPADGDLRCNVASAKVCPSGFYCSDDGTCWRNGHAPAPADMSALDNPLDMAVLDLSDRSCAADVCAGNVLRKCNTMGMFDDTTCALGCSVTGGVHCNVFYPTAPVANSDLTTPGVGALTLATTTTLHGDTGAIDGLRAANSDPTRLEVNGGVGFHLVSGVGIFVFGGLTMPAGVTVHLAGPNPIALVSTTDLTVAGIIDAQGPCAPNVAVAGGATGGAANSGGDGANGMGAGAGGGGKSEGSSNCAGAGGGGAGHGDVGGKGGNGGCFTPANGGSAGANYDTAILTTLRGGSGGGAGGALTGMGMGGAGGSGGGALQLVAAGTITIGSGSATAGVNAGGCGGNAQGGTVVGGGGGGGAGGAVVVEAPSIRILSGAVLAANGGGGGGSTVGGNGSLDAIRAPAGGSGASAPGRGGAGASPSGEPGIDSTSSGGGSGGGGGAVGRIRLSSFGAPSTAGGTTLSPAATQTQIDAR